MGQQQLLFLLLIVVENSTYALPTCSGVEIAGIMHIFWNALFAPAAAAAVTFTVPSRSGEGSYKYASVDPAPVGIS